MLDKLKFRTGRSIITWSFDVPLRGELPEEALRRVMVTVLEILDGFARPARIRFSSDSRGEFGTTLEPGLDIAAATRAFDEVGDVYTVDVELDIVVADLGGAEHELKGGAKVSLVLDEPEPGKREVYVNLALNTDIYAARTLVPEPTDNPHAPANAPRLAAFLARLRERLATRLYDLQADWYASQVDEHGFR
jgi:hypothetical protein